MFMGVLTNFHDCISLKLQAGFYDKHIVSHFRGFARSLFLDDVIQFYTKKFCTIIMLWSA